ncbi:MAG: TIGR00269 family protein [Nanoarchaeota archaeon]|nr:TIGR00269 family protein [Nanoarchaeota archaeon]
MCKICKTKPIIQLTNTNISLCKSCFLKYFEKKTFKTIKKYDLIEKNDKILVAISGGKDSLTVLNILNKLRERLLFKIEALLIDEGIKNYRGITIIDAKNFCKKNNIKLTIVSFKKEFKYPLDSLIKKINLKPCTVCGVLRRYLLNKYSKKLKATKLVTGHNLDDEAQSILMNQFKHNIEISARLGPITGVISDKKFIKRIKPLYLLNEKETATYAYLNNFNSKYVECPYTIDSYRNEVRDMLNNFENKYPGTKHAIVNSFLDILPLLKDKYKTNKKIISCKKCKEPSSKEYCQACEILRMVGIHKS